MQELIYILTGIAGAVTAGAIHKFPRSKPQLSTLGSSAIFQSQLGALEVERQILTKTISRLYQSDVGLQKAQCDKLLVKYQHQLATIVARIEKLESAKNHPDMGPLGDGLVTLMDQKLSQLDQRMYEISSRLTVASTQPKTERAKPKETPKKEYTLPKTSGQKPIELTTLTSVTSATKFPNIQPAEPQRVEAAQGIVGAGRAHHTQQPKTDPAPSARLPDPKTPRSGEPPNDGGDEDDDLKQVKSDIKQVLDRLAEAEVD